MCLHACTYTNIHAIYIHTYIRAIIHLTVELCIAYMRILKGAKERSGYIQIYVLSLLGFLLH